jgi:hypothetical protein
MNSVTAVTPAVPQPTALPPSQARSRAAVPTRQAVHQPRSLRAMANEHVLNDNRQSLFNVVDKSTATQNNCVVKEITLKIPMDEHTFLTKAQLTLCDLLERNRNTKIELKLTCIMTRTDMATGTGGRSNISE